MAQGYVLFNEKAGNGRGKEGIEGLTSHFSEPLSFLDMTTLEGGYEALLNKMEPDDFLVLCGGDGTLNCFVNDAGTDALKHPIWYFPTGSGNDFARELGKNRGDAPVLINRYIENLPTVTINGKGRLFINGVGFGIDGYCCEKGDELREKSTKAINYTTIAIKGILYAYKATGATVVVDGKEYCYQKVWIVPTMKGHYYGGGIMPAPRQNRLDAEGTVSVMIFHDSSRLKTLLMFPNLFKTERTLDERYVTVLTGKEVSVTFDAPRALQIDGETVKNVTSYSVSSKVVAKTEQLQEA